MLCFWFMFILHYTRDGYEVTPVFYVYFNYTLIDSSHAHMQYHKAKIIAQCMIFGMSYKNILLIQHPDTITSDMCKSKP